MTEPEARIKGLELAIETRRNAHWKTETLFMWADKYAKFILTGQTEDGKELTDKKEGK